MFYLLTDRWWLRTLDQAFLKVIGGHFLSSKREYFPALAGAFFRKKLETVILGKGGNEGADPSLRSGWQGWGRRIGRELLREDRGERETRDGPSRPPECTGIFGLDLAIGRLV